MPTRLLIALCIAVPVWGYATELEQRERLPDAAMDCGDPIDGTWVAHVYYPHVSEWYVFTLTLGHTGEVVLGTLTSHFWPGTEMAAEVPACGVQGRYPLSVVQPVRGTWANGQLTVNATSFVSGGPGCTHVGPGEYLLDNFSGPVDVGAQEWASVLDADSPLWTSVPTLFRRVRCADEPPRRVVDVPAPPVPTSSGCGW